MFYVFLFLWSKFYFIFCLLSVYVCIFLFLLGSNSYSCLPHFYRYLLDVSAFYECSLVFGVLLLFSNGNFTIDLDLIQFELI